MLEQYLQHSQTCEYRRKYLYGVLVFQVLIDRLGII